MMVRHYENSEIDFGKPGMHRESRQVRRARELQMLKRGAFYGGRYEESLAGGCVIMDINSAYPFAMKELHVDSRRQSDTD
jgi:hypothetical protein